MYCSLIVLIELNDEALVCCLLNMSAMCLFIEIVYLKRRESHSLRWRLITRESESTHMLREKWRERKLLIKGMRRKIAFTKFIQRIYVEKWYNFSEVSVLKGIAEASKEREDIKNKVFKSFKRYAWELDMIQTWTLIMRCFLS